MVACKKQLKTKFIKHVLFNKNCYNTEAWGLKQRTFLGNWPRSRAEAKSLASAFESGGTGLLAYFPDALAVWRRSRQ